MATKVGAIYVEIRGDDTQWKKDMAALRSAAAESGKNVSDALNSAINPSKASSGIKTISTGLTQLAQTAKVPESQFKQTADAITDAFSDVAKSVGMTRKEFSDLNERMLRNKAFQTATNELKSLSYAAGLSVSETKKLAQQMGYTSSQAGEMANKIHRVQQESELEVVVEWISTNDGRVRDDHKHADGQTRPIGQPFNVGGELLMVLLLPSLLRKINLYTKFNQQRLFHLSHNLNL